MQVRSLLKSWQIRVLDAVRTTSRSELAQRDKDEPRVAALGQGPGEIRARGDVTYVAWARGKLASQLNYGCSHATTATHSVIKVCLFDYQNYIQPTIQVYIITFVVLFPFLIKCNKQVIFKFWYYDMIINYPRIRIIPNTITLNYMLSLNVNVL